MGLLALGPKDQFMEKVKDVKEQEKIDLNLLHLLLVHCLLVDPLLTINFISAYVNKTLDTSNFSRFQQDVSSQNIILGKLKRVAE